VVSFAVTVILLIAFGYLVNGVLLAAAYGRPNVSNLYRTSVLAGHTGGSEFSGHSDRMAFRRIKENSPVVTGAETEQRHSKLAGFSQHTVLFGRRAGAR
jgi:hypothetical protein